MSLLTVERPKVEKPSEDFPLFPHPRGYWAKKILGKAHYFGRVDEDPKGVRALAKYNAEKHDLHAGRIPREKVEGFSVRDLTNQFLTSKRRQVERGDIKPKSFSDYHAVCRRMVRVFGPGRSVVDLGPSDFERLRDEIAKGRTAYTVKGQIIQTRTVLGYAYENRLIDRPIVFGTAFSVPSAKEIRKSRRDRTPRLFTAPQIRDLIDRASIPLRAMILLGINCGFGNTDCSELQESSIDFTEGKEVIDFPRPKTGVGRRCPLWPETVMWLKTAIIERPKARSKADADCAFLTVRGRRWVRETLAEIGEDGEISGKRKSLSSQTNGVTQEFGKLLDEAGIKGRGLGYYVLRHVFRTVADELADRPAIDRVMGHERPDVANNYREAIGDERLRAVTDHVRAWLFPKAPKAKKARRK